jgi:predicted  nucleic acid-binding Zn-ribbon protein
MSLFDEILQGLPVNSLLREKVADLRTEVDGLRAENASCRDDLSEAKAQISKLQKQIASLTNKPALEDVEIEIVRLLAKHIAIREPEFPHLLDVSLAKAKHHLAQLKSHGYVRTKKDFPFMAWMLTDKGLAFANDNHLN